MGVSHYRDQDLEVVIAGGGRVGRETATLMRAYGHRTTVIEGDPRIARAHSDDREDVTFVQGDATERSTLLAAGVGEADILLALTDKEATNVEICQQAARLAPEAHRVARSQRPPAATGDPDAVEAFVFPERAGARVAIGRAFGAPIQPVTDLSTRFEVVEIKAEPDAPATGQSLAELDLPTEATVITDLRTEHPADGDVVIEPGCQYLIAIRPDAVGDLKALFQHQR
ncbi:MAG: TrkA family potassium uptake protein [Salinibacter sp.]